MTFLHSSFSSNQLLVWAGPALDRPSLLSAAVALVPHKRVSEWRIWLPTSDRRPVFQLDQDLRGCVLAPYKVAALSLDAKQSVGFLAACIGKRVAAPGVLIGADVLFWVEAMRIAAGLVRRGQFLPGLRKCGDGYEARWIPIIDGTLSARVEALAKAMPASARAVTTRDCKQPPDAPPQSVLAEFLEFIVDGLIREDRPQRAYKGDSLHDRWQSALISDDACVPGNPVELGALARDIEQWQRPVRAASTAPFRLSFRLLEPEEDSNPWSVTYLLQGAKDPSLLVPAAKVWRPKAKDLALLGANPAQIREHLLVSLGEAASLSAEIEGSLKHSTPAGYTTDSGGAYRFLRETAGGLEQAGFGVMLPLWWTGRGAQARLQAKARVKTAKASAASGLSLETIVDFDWQLALGGEDVSRTELLALAKMKQPLVKLRGQWVEVDAAEIQRAIEYLKTNPGGRASVRDLMRMQIGVETQAGPLEIGGVAATGAIGDLLSRLQERAPYTEISLPAGLNASLRPYQRAGFSWLDFLRRLGLGACLADDMGLGKTIQTLAFLQREREQGERRPVLLVCPTSVVNNWQKEAAKFTPDLPVAVHHGASRKRGDAFRSEAAAQAVVLSSYSLLQRDIEALKQVEWAGLILDEAQNIKNAGTKQARAARSIAAEYRIALTGTPVENNVADLWSLMEFLNPGFLGSESGFRKKFFVPIQVYSDNSASERLKRITLPFILRRLKSDKSIIADLPDKFEAKVFCNLTKEQASLYEAVVKEAQAAIESSEGIERKGLVLATLMKLKQVCNHPAQFLKDRSAIEGRSGKLARLSEMLEETLEANDRSLIFTQFTEMGDLIQRHLQQTFGIEVLYLHGATAKKKRDEMVERFADKAGPRIFLLSLKAGGTGLNLVQASHVFHYDRWWNPAVENQATDRAFRIGQTKNVQVHKFVCAGTLEEKIDEMIERKKDVAGKVVGAGEAWVSEMSNDQLRDLFALRKEAVGE